MATILLSTIFSSTIIMDLPNKDFSTVEAASVYKVKGSKLLKNNKPYTGIYKDKYYKKGYLATGTYKGNQYVDGDLYTGETGDLFLDNGHINPLAKNGKGIVNGFPILEMKNGVAYHIVYETNPYSEKKVKMTGLHYFFVNYARDEDYLKSSAYVGFDSKGKLANGYYKLGTSTSANDFKLIKAKKGDKKATEFKNGYPTSKKFFSINKDKLGVSYNDCWNPYFNK